MKKSVSLRQFSLTGIGTVLALASWSSHSQTTPYALDGGQYYGGISAGQSKFNFDQQRIADRVLGAGVGITSMTQDNRDAAYKLFGGYQLNRNLALEAGYFDLGNFGFVANTSPPGTVSGRTRLRGVNLDLVGTIPLTDRFAALARLGAQHASTRDSFTGTGVSASLNQSPSRWATNYKFGAGLQYAVNQSMVLRAEAERYRIDDAAGGHGNVNVFSVSLVIPLGHAAESAPRQALAPVFSDPAPAAYVPAPVAVAPTPEPVAVVAPPVAPMPPAKRSVAFSADTLFTFDKSAVKAEGKQELDKFAQELSGAQYDVITVDGHTDRLGTAAYNQKLSTTRADAVKTYLVESGGIPASKIAANGKGESQPVTKPEDCKGKVANAKLIACLQPDRRVDVEVQGTR